MIAKDLFEKIGFTKDMVDEYNRCRAIFGDEGDRIARAYMREGKDFDESLNDIRKLSPDVNEYTANLVFFLECTGYAYEDYKAQNISDEIFYDSFMDMTYKMKEWGYKGVFGTVSPEWTRLFIDLKCFKLGRLQYEPCTHKGDAVKIGDFVIEQGARIVNCHIPSSGPLLQEDVVESLKRAYEFFKDRIKDGILAIECHSWFFCPEYSEIFKENAKNIYNFTQNFYVYKPFNTKEFSDIWRIFGVEADNYVVDELQEDTRLQKAFKKHIKEGKKFGEGHAVILFDGENILTRKDD